MDNKKINDMIRRQNLFFQTGETKKIPFRIRQLKILKKALLENKNAILDALKMDLGKPVFEAFMGEIYSVRQEIDFALRHVRKWARPRPIRTPLTQMAGRGEIHPEPYGRVLIIAPWNFPFNLVMIPLVGAVAAGNCAVVKPSELAPNTSKAIARIIGRYFKDEYIAVVEGGVKETRFLLEQKSDYIFYTGSTSVGRIVMEAASRHLTPVTLELGGKSPCIVDKDIPVAVAARRIAWAKFYNAGQTCVAVDYVAVHKDVSSRFIPALAREIKKFYSPGPGKCPDMACIISRKHFDRVSGYLKNRKDIITGGWTDKNTLYIQPALLGPVPWTDPVMKEEIFGPILPILEYGNLDELIGRINGMPKPLALYVFSRNKKVQEKIVRQTSSGGILINDSIIQFLNLYYPFGGVGNSGMGRCHGEAGFRTFSHEKPVYRKSFLLDFFFFRYPPYGKLHEKVTRFF